MKRVLVTGGSGLVGNALKQIRPEWIYLSSKDVDFTNLDDCKRIFKQYEPLDGVVHLAAKVGGLYMNMDNNTEMFLENMKMQINVFECCVLNNIQYAVFCLSTCIFPNNPSLYPLTEEMLHDGPPHDSNYGYSYAKRMMEVLCRHKYTCVIPTNIYGPFDNFNLQNGHIIPALIHKAYLARKNNESLKIKGTGQAVRQFIHSSDVASCIDKLLFMQPQNIILSPDHEISINVVALIIAKEFGITNIEYNSSYSDGQLRKTSCNNKLKQLFPDIQFKSFNDGIKETIQWFRDHYTSLRK